MKSFDISASGAPFEPCGHDCECVPQSGADLSIGEMLGAVNDAIGAAHQSVMREGLLADLAAGLRATAEGLHLLTEMVDDTFVAKG